ncbi:hypothetical protein D3C87_1469090 [compost metagenome]
MYIEGVPAPDRHAVQVGATLGPDQRHAHIGMETHGRAAQREFDAGGAGRVAEQPVAHLERQAVRRARAAHPEAAEAHPAEILYGRLRAGTNDFDHARYSSTMKRTVSPGAKRDGGSRSATKSWASVCPISCQPPGSTAG